MKLINIGDKIVSVGTTVVMPGADIQITAEQAKLPAIGILIAKKFVKIEDDPVAEKPAVEEIHVSEQTAEETPVEKKTTYSGRKRGMAKVTKEA